MAYEEVLRDLLDSDCRLDARFCIINHGCKVNRVEADTIAIPKGASVSEFMRYKNFIGIVLDGNIQVVSTDHEGNRTITENLKSNDIFGSKITSLSDLDAELIAIKDSKVIIIEYFALTNNTFNTQPFYQQFISNLT